ncbi:unnamed protein product [Sphagnum troendelagicum]|uniref:Uncharacterized protein n=1 Tax=Sphagnum troendelagicum TaxID=128251 RepID=A0ABP0TF98_9BRYO
MLELVVVVPGERASDSRELCMTSKVPTVSRWLWRRVFSLVHMSAFFFQYYAIKWMLAAPSTAASMNSISSDMLAAPCDLQLHLATGCLHIHVMSITMISVIPVVRQSLSSCLVFGSPLGTMSFASD